MTRPHRSNPTTMHQAGELRREPTPAEAELWKHLRRSAIQGVRFRRQHAIGPYITDFCSPSHKLVIELDGGQHFEQEDYDEERSGYLESQGFRVLRFWNNAVLKDIQGVLRAISAALE